MSTRVETQRLCNSETHNTNMFIYLFILTKRFFCQVNEKLKRLADETTENTQFLQDLADKVADFAVELLDQVHTKEEATIMEKDGHYDHYGSLFSEMTRNAIIYKQKKVRYEDSSPEIRIYAYPFLL